MVFIGFLHIAMRAGRCCADLSRHVLWGVLLHFPKLSVKKQMKASAHVSQEGRYELAVTISVTIDCP